MNERKTAYYLAHFLFNELNNYATQDNNYFNSDQCSVLTHRKMLGAITALDILIDGLKEDEENESQATTNQN